MKMGKLNKNFSKEELFLLVHIPTVIFLRLLEMENFAINGKLMECFKWNFFCLHPLMLFFLAEMRMQKKGVHPDFCGGGKRQKAGPATIFFSNLAIAARFFYH